ncbi:MAG: hypothetical protein JWQ18_815 [Conexibacter sp.]|nr:hypothetical protein [Conexibacter sp.]
MSVPEGRPLRVVIADDQTIVRDGLVTLLELMPDIDVVAAVGDGQQALDAVARFHPDAILLDLHMPVLDGIAATAHLGREHPGVAVVVLTTYADDESILAALNAGARGYLTKNTNRHEISRALHTAAAGQTILDPEVGARLLASAQAAGPRALPEVLPDGLTPREAEVLRLLCGGLTNGEIAAQLVISEHTVKTHINHLFAKTGSRDRAQAINYARDQGLE